MSTAPSPAPSAAPAANPYDAVDYPSHPLPQTHPDRLATLATLFGLSPAPVEGCRVLELGCGSGENLVAMAQGLPGSCFVGVDLAEQPIARGKELAAACGLGNVTFAARDLTTLGDEHGSFDYIVAHGLYSWVPEKVQDAILALCGRLLAPNGVAYVSYNAYPGCHLRDLVNRMLRWHVREVDEPKRQVEEGIALMRFLAGAKAADDAYGMVLSKELKHLEEYSLGATWHDDLSPCFSPCYFHEFVARSGAHGLQYLAETEFHEMQDRIFPPQVAGVLAGITDRLTREQYLDFLKGRRFRQTLLCRADLPVDAGAPARRIAGCLLASQAKAVSATPNLAERVVEEFRGDHGGRAAIDLPLAKAALVHLAAEWPRRIAFADLLATARARVAAAGGTIASAGTESELIAFCFATYSAGLIEAHVHAPALVREPGPRPVVSPLARVQAARGPEVATLRHTVIRLEDPLVRALVTLLDGSRDRATLIDALATGVESGAIAWRGAAADARSTLTRELDTTLRGLAAMALIIA